MAPQTNSHPAIAAGLAGGVGFMLPAAAFLISLPFEGAHRLITQEAVPFVIGWAAGVGVCALSYAALNRASARSEEQEEEPHAVEELVGEAQKAAHTGFFSRRHAPDVPIITRAADALTEAEAWEEIDKLLSEDSPISCDPARSKDIYEIAFAELARPLSTDPAAAAESAAAEPVAAVASAPAAASVAASVAEPVSAPAATPAPAPVAERPAAPAPVSAAVDAYQAAALADLDEPSDEVSVPVADYHGREDIWAAALAILADESEASPVALSPAATPQVAAVAEPSVSGPVLAAERVREDEPNMSEERLEAIAEGERLTEMHGRINEILGEEVAKISSQSMRRTSREYLRVIQGGTMSMPRLQVKA